MTDTFSINLHFLSYKTLENTKYISIYILKKKKKTLSSEYKKRHD